MFGLAKKKEVEEVRNQIASLALAAVDDGKSFSDLSRIVSNVVAKTSGVVGHRDLKQLESDIARLENNVETLTQIVNHLVDSLSKKDGSAPYMER